jgi:hypothetical protein
MFKQRTCLTVFNNLLAMEHHALRAKSTTSSPDSKALATMLDEATAKQ